MRVVADSHAFYWFLFDADRLSPAADRALRTADETGQIVVSAATLLELWLVGQKGRLPSGQVDVIRAMFRETNGSAVLRPVDVEVAERFASFPAEAHCDPWDRLVVATALVEGVPLVTKDRALHGLGLVETVW